MGKARDFRLLLIRAGRTAWDDEQRLAGGADLPLTADAVGAVRLSAEGMEHAEVGVLLSGPDEASVQTAEIVARGLGVRARRLAGLAEPGLGLWQGMLGADLEQRCPSVYRQWLQDPASVSPPQGEPLAEASRRIISELVRSMRRVRQEHPGVAVVARPMARALIRCWVSRRGLGALWSEMDAGRDAEWHLIESEQIDAPLVESPAAALERVRIG